MKLRELNQGDKFKYAQYPNGEPYVMGNKIPGSIDQYYVESKLIGYVYIGWGGDEVIKVGSINEE